MQKKDFDLQLGKNLNELPAYSPSDFAWERIEEKLEDQKIVFPWKAFLIASSVAGFFLIAFFLLRQETVKIDSPKPTSQATQERQLPEKSIQPAKPETAENTTIQINEKESQPKGKVKKQRIRDNGLAVSNRPPISVLNEPTSKELKLDTREKYTSVDEVQEKTYHSVAISWELDKIKFQVKTNFGAQDPILLESTGDEKSELQARIRLQRKNITNKTN
ncbi:hypothetical protein Aconfl_30540 [Algoriphagus confluentis]|uniref:Anti-sigma factor n=2 Tax=Algoriphagus confluentis TaxID=1697556 RepID=A0ABQ6PR12_9BACT|nr:hypothetical protein Aconfl_30540 [Algoriphagus confluentis]